VLKNEIYINAHPGEARIALVSDGELIELLIDRPDQGTGVGNVYLGRVEKVLAGIQAAFVDIGSARSGFLALPEARPQGPEAPGGGDGISDYVREGDAVLVQVQRDPFDGKGAKLTRRVTLPGRYLVFAPGQTEVKVSRRIAGDGARAALKTTLSELVKDGESLIARTAAANAGPDSLRQDLGWLREAWTKVEEARSTNRPPALLYAEPDPMQRALRDWGAGGLNRVVVDAPETLTGLKEYLSRVMPDLAGVLELFKQGESLFEHFRIEEQIEAALVPDVVLPGGGNIRIEETAALTAIDVNTAGAGAGRGSSGETAFATNLEAAIAVARHIRLRNLSGYLVVDFVPLRKRENRARLLTSFRDAVALDSCPTHVIGYTAVGPVEVTRDRQRDTLSRVLGGPCQACAGLGWVKSHLTLAHEAVRALSRQAAAVPGTGLRLAAAPDIIAALEGPGRSALDWISERLGGALVLEAGPNRPHHAFEITPSGDREGKSQG